MIRCLHCGAETTNGLALCDLCRRAATTYLEYIPVHFGNLARWRPGRAGSRPVPGSREPQGALGAGQGDRVARCLDETGNDLVTWVRQLVDDRGVEVPYAADETNTVRVACWLLGENLTSISTLDWCGDLVDDLRRIESRLRHLSEQVVPGWYAGACRTCGTSTYVMPGVTWVTCSHKVSVKDEDGRRRVVDMGCGMTTHVATHLEVVLEEARGWVARPKALAEAAVALIDTEPSVPKLYARIRQWAAGDRLTPVLATKRDYAWDADEERFVVATVTTGHARYRFGEVLNLVLAEGSGHARDEDGRFTAAAG